MRSRSWQSWSRGVAWGAGMLVLGLGTGAIAAPGQPAPGRRDAGEMRLREKLNLSDDQKRRLADIRDQTERRTIPIQGDLRVARLDLEKLMRAEHPDPRAIDAQIDRIAALRASLQKSHVAGMLEARNVLTPAQQKLMRDAGPGLGMGRMRGGHGMHGMRGGPGMRGMGMDDGPGRGARGGSGT